MCGKCARDVHFYYAGYQETLKWVKALSRVSLARELALKATVVN